MPEWLQVRVTEPQRAAGRLEVSRSTPVPKRVSVLPKKSVDLKVSLAEPSISELQEFLECFSRYEFDRLCGLDLDLCACLWIDARARLPCGNSKSPKTD